MDFAHSSRAAARSEAAGTEEARPVRVEDAFDVEAVAAWLEGHGVEGVPEVRQFPGGASNLTYLLTYPGLELILRRPPGGAKARGAHDMRREHTIQSRLAPVFSYVPAMVAFCDDPAVLGSDFYVMERVPGTILRAQPPPGTDLRPQRAGRLCEAFVDRLVELHAVDPGAAGLSDLGRGSGYVERQVTGWSRRYRTARTSDVGDFEPVMGWLAERMPADVDSCVIHNDYRLDNVVLDPADVVTIRAVLDWEMATLGDPLMDLGGAMAYWLQADDPAPLRSLSRQPTALPGMWTRAEVVGHYLERTGRQLDDWRFYEVFGFFRLAVILQQIHYRYVHGQTTNEAFADFGRGVGVLERHCLDVLGR